jgi:hypothetical protein
MGKEEDISCGDERTSETLVELLIQRDGGTLMDYNVAFQKLVESGKYPLLLESAGEAGWYIENPDRQKRVGAPIIKNPAKGATPTPGFLLPDPLNSGDWIENPEKTDQDFAEYDRQEHKARDNAKKEVEAAVAAARAGGNLKVYCNTTFVGCAKPPDNFIQMVTAVIAKTGRDGGEHRSLMQQQK